MNPINVAKKPANLLGQIDHLLKSGQNMALLTLVHVEGSAPYPIGSQMLVSGTGQAWGQITGGCAETALIDHALSVIASGRNSLERYGLGSPYFDIQLPCGSGIDVLFNVETSALDYQRIIDAVAHRTTATLELSAGKTHFKKHYPPPERLLVFGQGAILAHLITLACECGFETIAVVQEKQDQDALHQLGFQAQLLHEVGESYRRFLDPYSALVSLFHEHERELPILKSALESEVFFVGALGSQQTHAQRLKELSLNGVSAGQLERVRGPVGLDIAAESPAQIAVSILAEIIQEMPKQRLLYA